MRMCGIVILGVCLMVSSGCGMMKKKKPAAVPSERERLVAQLAETQAVRDQLETDLGKMRTATAWLEEKMNNTRGELEKTTGELRKTQDELAAAQRTARSAGTAAEELQGQVKAAEDRAAAAEKQSGSVNEQVAELRRQIGVLTTQRQEAEKRAVILGGQVTALQRELAELRAAPATRPAGQ